MWGADIGALPVAINSVTISSRGRRAAFLTGMIASSGAWGRDQI
jgi:hypothetical protein